MVTKSYFQSLPWFLYWRIVGDISCPGSNSSTQSNTGSPTSRSSTPTSSPSINVSASPKNASDAHTPLIIGCVFGGLKLLLLILGIALVLAHRNGGVRYSFSNISGSPSHILQYTFYNIILGGQGGRGGDAHGDEGSGGSGGSGQGPTFNIP